MTAIKTKQNELDAKFASMLDSQHGHTQALNEIKSIFSKLLGLGRKNLLTQFKWNQNLPLDNSYNCLIVFQRKHQH
jgi:hypothetical protein